MNYEDLLLEEKNGIAIVTLNVPDKLNALTMKMKRSLTLVAGEIAKNDDVKVVIVTGAGRAFSAGADIPALKARLEGTMEQTRYEKLQRLGYWSDIFVKLDKPVIAAINGDAIGGGFALALNCDVRIASEKARLGAAFILRGLVPDCAMTYFLPRMVGTSKALEIMLTGKLIDAAEAERLGIVSQVVPPEELLRVSQELAAKIAEQPAVAVELTKRLVYRSMLRDIDHHLDWETYAQQLCFNTEDHKESTLAFLEKRPQPKFKGK